MIRSSCRREPRPTSAIYPTLLDTGHFALETHAPEIAEAIGEFLERPGVPEMKGAYRVAP
jgi:hypothetical protein